MTDDEGETSERPLSGRLRWSSEAVERALEMAARDIERMGPGAPWAEALKKLTDNVGLQQAAAHLEALMVDPGRITLQPANVTMTTTVNRVTVTITDDVGLSDEVHPELSKGTGTEDWVNPILVVLLLVYVICATDATVVWPGLKEPLESVEQRLAFVLGIYAFIWAVRQQKR